MSDDYSANVQTTGAVAVGGSATGTIETAHDQDWFAVELVAGRTYQFDLGGSPSGGGTLSDTFLRAIYDSEGRYQSDSYNDDFGGSRDSRVTFTASQSGTYYVRASGDRDETGSYTLRVSDVTPGSVENPPPVEPPAETVAPEEPEPARAAAEDLGDITELAAARFPLGTLDGGADAVAWYRFTLSEARAVALGLRRQDADADLVLEDAEGNVLHSSERSGTANEWLRETLLAGTYYVRVEAQEAGANAYVFRYGVGDADPAEVARLEAERLSAQEQEQGHEPPADPVVPPRTAGTANRIQLGKVSGRVGERLGGRHGPADRHHHDWEGCGRRLDDHGPQYRIRSGRPGLDQSTRTVSDLPVRRRGLGAGGSTNVRPGGVRDRRWHLG